MPGWEHDMKMDLGGTGGDLCTGFNYIWLRTGPLVDYSEHFNKHLGHKRGEEFDKLSD
jgi:hypothetical protein